MILCRNYRNDAEMMGINPVHRTAMTRLGIKEGNIVARVSARSSLPRRVALCRARFLAGSLFNGLTYISDHYESTKYMAGNCEGLLRLVRGAVDVIWSDSCHVFAKQ